MEEGTGEAVSRLAPFVDGELSHSLPKGCALQDRRSFSSLALWRVIMQETISAEPVLRAQLETFFRGVRFCPAHAR